MKQYKKYVLGGVFVCFMAVALMAPTEKSEAFWPFGKAKKENNANYTGAVANTESAKVKPVSSITVVSPNGGETLQAGKPYRIKWKTRGFSKKAGVSIILEEIFGGVVTKTTIASTTNKRSYKWLVPNDKAGSNIFRVNLVVDSPYFFDQSDGLFSIKKEVVRSSNKMVAPSVSSRNSNVSSELKENRTLSVSKYGGGSGLITGVSTNTGASGVSAGINCGTDCSEAHPQQTGVTLTATADNGSKFVSWNIESCPVGGSCYYVNIPTCVVTSPVCVFTVGANNVKVTAKFEKKNTIDNYEKLNIVGDKSMFGSYDPSVEYDNKGVGYLAYSGATNSEFQDIDTHLAKSMNGGKIWTYAAHISQAKKTTIAYKDTAKKTNVVQRYETPSLLFDPSDPDENGRWKLFLVSGFSVGDKGLAKDTIWRKSFVTFKKAKTPEMLSEAKETILFASEELPVGYSAKYNVDDFSPNLKKTIAYMEPGTLVKNGIIYLSLIAKSLSGEKTILLSSKDHGNSWNYAGILINDNEVVNQAYPILTSPSMAEENDRYFLIASPKLANDKGGYNGIYIFEFENIESAKLKRDAKGKLIVHKYVPTITTVGFGGGQSEYHSGNTYGGIIMSQSWMKAPINERFSVNSTKERIVDR